ncbi:hypothetical protein HME9302_02548 [Alteripontixanthobacter maritimus]|uniref:Uncharacterized protein n=1 Tax=Alteripontixanthobacter maritimus TaxID=2161824 RepID=A0A369QDK5_9SPHN|nr:hypothetical protein [Alteripontixanthobacter maritimus]RDC58875.1 hypothetical protein HME9302_00050 [Alteripontixanthobacter maritimus]RDC61327.1 hypothetical protein HME9302_02548 [Alteripontixanthobacter maritimus]
MSGFFEEGDWFAPKRFGYGAGMPIAWQGWVLLGGFIALAIGAGLLAEYIPDIGPVIALAVLIPATIVFLVIAARRTRGGWRWRWGLRNKDSE